METLGGGSPKCATPDAAGHTQQQLEWTDERRSRQVRKIHKEANLFTLLKALFCSFCGLGGLEV
jgi:hypothetical protein